MTNKTPEQATWLKSRSKTFAHKAFFQQILNEWLEAWPNPDPTPEEIQVAGGHDLAVKQKAITQPGTQRN